MMDQVSGVWVAEQREVRYRRTPERRIQTIDQARAFVDDVGFCFFWPIKDIEMPSLFHAIAGRIRPVPSAHNDPDLSKSWGWKDRSLGQRWWYYGKMLRRRATLISLDMLPFFYANSRNYGELDDYLEEYRSGTMTAEAKRVYETLLTLGPLDTVRLRREVHMAADSAKSRFERALVELQIGFKVLPIGVAEAGAWRYAFIYEIVARHYPNLPEAARQISLGQARRVLVARYLDNVVAADRRMVGRVFHVLGWTAADLDRTIAALLDLGVVRLACAQAGQDPWLVSVRVLEEAL
jgi:hypothetical protein